MELPAVDSPEFLTLVGASAGGPFVLCMAVYAVHFALRDKGTPVRTTKPLDKHSNEWLTALLRPEGIAAVVLWALFWLGVSVVTGVDVIPPCIKRLEPAVNPLVFVMYFAVFDVLMWCIHYCQHNIPWLYRATHRRHHGIASPTIIVALTGYLPDTMLLILVPLHTTLFLVPYGNFLTVVLFSVVSLVHLHMIHSSFSLPWDPLLARLGLVNTYDHHVHHVQPKRNLAHFFTAIDKIMGTYTSPSALNCFAQDPVKAQ